MRKTRGLPLSSPVAMLQRSLSFTGTFLINLSLYARVCRQEAGQLLTHWQCFPGKSPLGTIRGFLTGNPWKNSRKLLLANDLRPPHVSLWATTFGWDMRRDTIASVS